MCTSCTPRIDDRSTAAARHDPSHPATCCRSALIHWRRLGHERGGKAPSTPGSRAGPRRRRRRRIAKEMPQGSRPAADCAALDPGVCTGRTAISRAGSLGRRWPDRHLLYQSRVRRRTADPDDPHLAVDGVAGHQPIDDSVNPSWHKRRMTGRTCASGQPWAKCYWSQRGNLGAIELFLITCLLRLERS